MSTPALELVGEAYLAARMGRLEELEHLLVELQKRLDADLEGLSAELRKIAACVRAHPTYRPPAEENREAV